MDDNQYKIAIVDDEANIRNAVSDCLKLHGYSVSAFSDAYSALSQLRKNTFDLAIFDICLKDMDGAGLYQQMLKEKLCVPVIFISGNATLDKVAECIKMGAYDFLEKPISPERLIHTIKNCIEYFQLKQRVQQYEEGDVLLGEHPSMKLLYKSIEKIAKSDSAVFINGESGTGKELIARAIHRQSNRVHMPFVTVNCSAIPENLIESALFGHKKGAFTGADQDKKGYFEVADGGTLFLDEISDIPLPAQASLLRALENGEIQKVGSDRIQKTDVRVLAATHNDLNYEVERGNFRKDLFYRINIIPINTPALRERQSDILLLIHHFIRIVCESNGFKLKSVHEECIPYLLRYRWPGNVRELKNVVERMVILGGDVLHVSDLPAEVCLQKQKLNVEHEDLTLKEFKQMAERDFIVNALKKYNGNITEVAKQLDIDRSYLHKKLSQYGIKRDTVFS